jgi:hypothetical protein
MRRPLSGRIAAVVVAGVCAAWAHREARALAADPPACGSARPWVAVRDDVTSQVRFVDLLRAELAGRGIDLCADAGPGAPAPIASVSVSPKADAQGGGSEGLFDIEVEVRDALTAKRVIREFDLRALPADGRALAMSASVDEVLRASWAELALRTAPPPAVPVPPEVRATVRESLPPEAPTRPPESGFVGLLFAVDHFGEGQTRLGADVRVALSMLSPLGLELRLGVREGLPASAPDGDVRMTSVLAGLAGVFSLTGPSSRPGFGLLARLDVEDVFVAGSAVGGGRANAGSAAAMVGEAGARVWMPLGPVLRMDAEAAVGGALIPVSATDAGQRVTGVGGVATSIALGMGGRF